VFIPLQYVVPDCPRLKVAAQFCVCQTDPSHSWLRLTHSLIAPQPEFFVESPLSLLTQPVVNSRKYDDQFVAQVRRFCDERRIVGRLPALDMAENQTARLELVRTAWTRIVQVGGGFRTAEAVEDALAAGVDRVLVGTLALRDPPAFAALVARHGERICLTADSLEGSAIRDALAATKEFPGVTGKVTFNENRDAVKPIVMIKIQEGGKFVVAERVQVEGAAMPTTQTSASPATAASPTAPAANASPATKASPATAATPAKAASSPATKSSPAAAKSPAKTATP